MTIGNAVLVIAASALQAPDSTQLSQRDRIRLAEAFHLAAWVEDKLWAGWKDAPFAVLLIAGEQEFLLRHPAPSPDFVSRGYDSLLGTQVLSRARTQRPDLLATFPVVQGSSVPTIVIGRAERTAAATSTPWVVTLLHEHFHQLQYSQPGYYPAANALGLSRGDQSGMWMLNYPFPYTDGTTLQLFRTASEALSAAVGRGRNVGAREVQRYRNARERLRTVLAPENYRYLAFQAWQEGVARYTELAVARLAASEEYRPTRLFSTLGDHVSYAEVAAELERRTLRQLAAADLVGSGRAAFYAFGAGEAMLLDVVSPEWKSRYFEEKFDLLQYFTRP